MTHKVKRCANCGSEITVSPFMHNGKEYCRRTCQEFAALRQIEKAVRMQSPWYVVVAIIAVLFVLAVVNGPAKAHEPYSGWTIPGQSKSCCNMTDCAVTRAKFERGNWWAFVNSKRIWVKVPDDRIVRYKTDDNEAHLCYGETFGEVYCFRPPPTGM